MRIGLIHSDSWPLTVSGAIQSYQIYTGLAKKHTIIATNRSQFPNIKTGYTDKYDIFNFLSSVDVLLILVDGVVDSYAEKFTVLSKIRRKKIPVVWLVNAPMKESLLLSWFPKHRYFCDKLLRRFFSAFADAVICVSDDCATLVKEEIFSKNIHVIPNGSDPKLFDPQKTATTTSLRKALCIPTNNTVVVWSGGGDQPWQAMDVVIDTARQMYSSGKRVTFLLITDKILIHGSSVVRLPPNVVHIPSVLYTMLPWYLSMADIALALYTPQFNGLLYNSPMELFDYMSMEKLVIGSSLGQVRQVITHEKNGFLTENVTSDICRLIDGFSRHKEHYRSMGRQARKDVIRQYSWDRMVDSIDAVIAGVVK